MADEQLNSGTGRPRYTFDRVVRMVLSALVIVCVLLLLRFLADVLIPFVAAVALAYLLNPLVQVFEKKTKRRSTAVALTIGGLTIFGMALLAIGIPLVVSQASRFGNNVELLFQDVKATAPQQQGQANLDATGVDAGSSRANDATSHDAAAQNAGTRSLTAHDLTAHDAAAHDTGAHDAGTTASSWGLTELRLGWKEFLDTAHSRLSRAERLRILFDRVEGTWMGDLLRTARDYTKTERFKDLMLDAVTQVAVGGLTVANFILNVLLGTIGLIIVLLYLVFLLLDFPEYARTWRMSLPPAYRDTIVEFLHEFNVALRRYFRGQAVVAATVGILFAVGFTIIGLPMAVPFGLFVGLLNMVPYLQVVGLVPGVLLAALRAIEAESSLAMSIVLVLGIFAVVQVIQDALIVPRIMGKATGLRPVAILLGVFIWGKLLGFLGVLVAIPLTCLGIAYYRRHVLHHSREATKIADDPATA